MGNFAIAVGSNAQLSHHTKRDCGVRACVVHIADQRASAIRETSPGEVLSLTRSKESGSTGEVKEGQSKINRAVS